MPSSTGSRSCVGRGRVGDADRPERRGEDDAAARRCRSRSPRGPDRARRRSRPRVSGGARSRDASRSSRRSPAMPAGMTVREYVLLGRTPYLSYLGRESRRDLAAAGLGAEPPRPRRSRRPAALHALGRRASAGRARPRARPGGAPRPPRRADERARRRPSAGGARADRPAAPGGRPHGRRRHARPDARRPVRHAAACSSREGGSSPTARRRRC